jgi:putative transposase
VRLFKTGKFSTSSSQWIEAALKRKVAVRDARWSEAVAVGSRDFVEKVRSELGIKALHRELEQVDGTYTLRESGEAYRGQFDPQNEPLRLEDTLPWERIAEVAVS